MGISATTKYYNLHAKEKLNGFYNGNKRLELAWKTLCEFAPKKIINILEIGCGIRNMSYQMSRKWKNSKVTGIDLSDSAILIANKLFSSKRIEFFSGSFNEIELNKPYDLIVLFDVYEHIGQDERDYFNERLNFLLNPGGILFLSIPSPIYQEHIKQFHPNLLQPVDESITLNVLSELSLKCNAEMIFYKNVNIYFHGDYSHIVFKKKLEGNRFQIPMYLSKPLIIRIILKIFIYLIYDNPILSRKRIRIFNTKRKLKHIDL